MEDAWSGKRHPSSHRLSHLEDLEGLKPWTAIASLSFRYATEGLCDALKTFVPLLLPSPDFLTTIRPSLGSTKFGSNLGPTGLPHGLYPHPGIVLIPKCFISTVDNPLAWLIIITSFLHGFNPDYTIDPLNHWFTEPVLFKLKQVGKLPRKVIYVCCRSLISFFPIFVCRRTDRTNSTLWLELLQDATNFSSLIPWPYRWVSLTHWPSVFGNSFIQGN